MCYEPDEYYECYESAIRKARKPHKCDGCFQPIESGDLYKYGSGIFQGEPVVDRVCGACELRVYRLHIIELAEGCPPWSSWYPPYDAIEAMCEHARNAQYYDDEENRTPINKTNVMAMAFKPMTSVPTKEQGQAYLGMLRDRNTDMAKR
jgi:hypothetical protein